MLFVVREERPVDLPQGPLWAPPANADNRCPEALVVVQIRPWGGYKAGGKQDLRCPNVDYRHHVGMYEMNEGRSRRSSHPGKLSARGQNAWKLLRRRDPGDPPKR